MAARLSINQMDSGDIQRGQGERFILGGGRFQGLEGLKLCINFAKFRGEGGV